MATPSGEDFGALSNAMLKDRVSETSGALRELAEKQKRQRDNLFSQLMPIPKDEFGKFQKEHAGKYQQTTLKQAMGDQRKFETELLPVAIALRDEMKKRLGDKFEPPKESVPALDLGALCGTFPLEKAANELERIASQLPE